MIAVVDFDVGNLAAVANMLNRLGYRNEVTADPGSISRASHIILPGNGAFDACMRGLRGTGLIPVIEDRVLGHGTPLLGICVGAQMLGHGSEEGTEPGLGWLEMRARRFPDLPGLHVPHMGWSQVKVAQEGHAMTTSLEADARYYFVHSYYLDPSEVKDVLLWASYGIEFAAAVARGNISGVQFHPEKSHRFGKHLLQAFAESS